MSSVIIDYKFRPSVQIEPADIEAYYQKELLPELAKKNQPRAGSGRRRGPDPRSSGAARDQRTHREVAGRYEIAFEDRIDAGGRQLVKFDRAVKDMTGTKRKFGLKHGMALVVATGLAFVLALAYVIGTGLADRWASGLIVQQLESATGARVELGKPSIRVVAFAREIRRAHLARTRAGRDASLVSCRPFTI